MNWIHQEINSKIIGLLLIGILVGGLAMGFVDSKNLNPLFSSADDGGTILDACSSQLDTLENFVDGIPDPIPEVYRQYYLHQTGYYLSQVYECVETDTSRFLYDWEARRTAELQQRTDEWRQELNQTDLERQAAWREYDQLVRDSQAAHDTYNNNCVINPGDDRSSNTNNQLKSTTESASKITSGVGANKVTDYPDCQELWNAYLEINAAAEEARLTAEAFDERMDELAAEIRDIEREVEQEYGQERDNYFENADYTREYATDYAGYRFTGSSPYQYYNCQNCGNYDLERPSSEGKAY